MSGLESIQQYPNSEILTNICKSFEEQEISLHRPERKMRQNKYI